MRKLVSRKRVRAALDTVLPLVPSPWNIDALVQLLAAHRGRPIHVVPWDFETTSVSGMLLSTDDADYIFVARGSTPTRREQIIGHELGHLVFGHTSTMDGLEGVADLLAPDVSPDLRRRMLLRAGYEAVEEAEAEEFGTRLVRLGVQASRHGGSEELRRLTDSIQ